MNPDAVQHERDRNIRNGRSEEVDVKGTFSLSPPGQPCSTKRLGRSIECQTDVTLSQKSAFADVNSGPPSHNDSLGVSHEHTPAGNARALQDLPSPYFLDDPDEGVPFQLVMNEKVVWERRDENPMNPPATSRRADISFQVAFLNPSLVCERYPMEFRPTRILDSDLLINGWRRHFIYYLDWIRTFEEFQQLCLQDQLLLAKNRLCDHGWLSHSYHTMLSGRPGICFANGGFHPHQTDVQWPNRDKRIDEFYESQTKACLDHLITPLKEMVTDYAEFVMLKAIHLFRDEPGLSLEGMHLVRQTRKKYLRILYKYLRQQTPDKEHAMEKFTQLLSLTSILTALKSMMDDRVMMNSCFSIIEFDSLIVDVHNGELRPTT